MQLSGIVIAKNEEKMINDCLVSLEFCDEVIVVDSGCTDKTIEIAKSNGARIVKTNGTGYSDFRNDGLTSAKGEWILYLDADERITPKLRQEIIATISSSNFVHQIPRKNIYLGKVMHHGGWGEDKVIRLFPKNKLKRFTGKLHEQPEFLGELQSLREPMTHFSHRDLESMLDKTLQFTKYEANLRLVAGHPQIVSWRLLRVMFTEFWLRFVKLQAWRDGVEGIIDGTFQVFNTFIIYARLWEAQIKS